MESSMSKQINGWVELNLRTTLKEYASEGDFSSGYDFVKNLERIAFKIWSDKLESEAKIESLARGAQYES